MKTKTFCILFLIFLLIVISDKLYKCTFSVLETSDDCRIGIDLNENDIITDNEFYKLKNIYDFCSTDGLENNQKVFGNLNENQKIYFKIKSKNFYEKLFLNKRIYFVQNNPKFLNFDFEKIILENGLATAATDEYKKFENIDKVKENLKNSLTKKYYVYNAKSAKYHTINCHIGANSRRKEFLTFDELPQNAKPCRYCIIKDSPEKITGNKKNIKPSETVISNGNIKIYQSLAFNVFKPSNDCNSSLCKSLKTEINNAKSSIDIAIYELYNQNEIVEALIDAKKRGVKIRVVTDDSKINNSSEETYKNIEKFADTIYTDANCIKNSQRLMHNKFFIFDNNVVWTGSTNVTNTGISGFNTNSVVCIKSKDVANYYKEEFENFVNNKFHSEKTNKNTNSAIVDSSKISVYFSPQDKPITTQIIPDIQKAQKYIYVPVFYFTHKKMAEELIKAHNKGVDVKVIIDATSAVNKYSQHKILRQNSIPLKVENFAGKMHMKSVIIDDKVVFLGSMNFTKSGDLYNDENCLRIENSKIARKLKMDFLTIWNSIPDKYLYKTPRAESFESIGSCYDGVDNDFDGFIDKYDSGCKVK
ncbi:MAG: phosphatidylserine/phosphatidylglycerophosphate/cardiolipin synthase family protein [Candidatus Gastranaerophilaceae bacterium]